MRCNVFSALALCCLFVVFTPAALHAQAAGCGVAVVEAAFGDVHVTRADGRVEAAAPGLSLCPGDRLATSSPDADAARPASFGLSHAALRFPANDKIVRLGGEASIAIPGDREDAEMSLSRGVVYVISTARRLFRVRTEFVTAGIDGTEATVHARPGEGAAVAVVEGTVRVRAPGAELAIGAGEVAFAPPGGAPRRVGPEDAESLPPAFRVYVVRPTGATDWAAYVPPSLLAPLDAADRACPAPSLAAAGPRDAQAASCLLQAALAGEDRAALQAASAADAAGASPDWLLARSYARQSLGDLDGARAAAAEALAADPASRPAQVRLAETELLLGDASAAMRLLGPTAGPGCAAGDAHVHALRGFAQLSLGRRDDSAASFDCAVALASTDPSGRLGRGLAALRRGETEAGVADLETAVALDPTRADTRAWLGRAWLEEGRSEKAAAQFDLSAEADPDDPTPRLFSALERFAANDPVGALAQIEAARELGDRRATLRDRAGLVEDEGVRGAALSRVYATLDFERLATLEGADAAERAPVSAEAHYFLSDAYRGRQDFEVAQSSELLVADLLAPVGRRLPQSQLAETDLALLDTVGAARVTFAEFAPAFDSDGVFGALSGQIGTQETLSGEMAIGMLFGNVSLAASHFHAGTDGFAFNNDVTHDVTQIQGRARVGADTTLYGDVLRRSSESGLRTLTRVGNPLDFAQRQDVDRLSGRLGVHQRFSADSSLIATVSAIDSETTDYADSIPAIVGGPPLPCSTLMDLTNDADAEGADGQARWLGRVAGADVTAGGSFTRIDGSNVFALTPQVGACPFLAPINATVDADETHASAYGYVRAPLTDQVEVTLGLAAARFDGLGVETDRVLPKLGLRVEPMPGLVLRAAWLQQVKRPFLADRTLEPTSVAGFNQLHDDGDGAFSEMAAVGVDLRVAAGLWIGGSANRREVETPAYFPGSTIGSTETHSRVTTGELHLYATPVRSIAVALELEQQRFEGLSGLGGGPLALPESLDTTALRGSLSWFGRDGLFAQGVATWLMQSEVNAAGRALPDYSGLIVDAAIGWRLPDRRGVIALEGRNLLDAGVRYRDVIFDTPRPQSPRFSRDPAVFLTATLAF